MAKHYDTETSKTVETGSLTPLLAALETFVAGCRTPAAMEPGEDLIALLPGEFAFEIRSGKLWLDMWHGQRSISRRILSLGRRSPGMLECVIHRFAAAPGKLTLLDTSQPQSAHKKTTAQRESFGAQFRGMLFRQFPGWELRAVSAGMDLQRSFSPNFPRAQLVRGQQQVAAMALPSVDREPEVMTFALLWFDHLVHRKPKVSTQLCLFVPENAGALTAHRLHWLRPQRLRSRIFRFNEHGMAGEVDPADLGNLDTRVTQQFRAPELSGATTEQLRRLAQIEGVTISPETSGGISIRFRGMEFARYNGAAFELGMEHKRLLAQSDWHEVEQFAVTLQNLASPEAARMPYRERWLEGLLRDRIASVDASLRTQPVHSQVLTFAGQDRDLVDLLAVSHDGRLAVLELKASEDLHLPMQALDYWMRIHWHAGRGELDHLFPGIALSRETPLLRLVAPALSFHSTHAAVLRYFSPDVDVERIGVNSDWGRELKVVLRLKGGDDPQSQGGTNEFGRLAGDSQSHRQPEPRARAGTE